MDVGGGYHLSADQESAWRSAYPDEYADYVDAGLYNPETNMLYDIPEWMNDGDPSNGPFDFNINKSHGTSGW